MNATVKPTDILAQAAKARGDASSQATTVEQSRAIAEVQGALVVAQQRPRNQQRALAAVEEACSMQAVAGSAFFKFPRGSSTVSGESIHLAVELARCWGNITYAIVELDRDDVRGQSEMLAYAWDLETNASSRLGFIVPHKRDKKGGAEVLSDLRDIYENNANMGARRLRECIFRVIPRWLIEAATEKCRETLAKGVDGKPLAVQLNEAVKAFGALGIDPARIEARYGPIASMTTVDLVNLKVSYRSVSRKEIDAEEEFPRVAHVETATALAATKRAAPERPAPVASASVASDTAQPAASPTTPFADEVLTDIAGASDVEELEMSSRFHAEAIGALATSDPALHERLTKAFDDRRTALLAGQNDAWRTNPMAAG
jgi:hypothetical protein